MTTLGVNGSGRSPIPVVIVADVRLYREGLAHTLTAFPQLAVVGTAGSAPDAVRTVQQTRPDVAIVDMAMPGGLDLCHDLRSQQVPTRIIAFGVDEDIGLIIQCAQAGAAGYVTLHASIEELVATIERTVAGELECGPRVAAELFKRMADQGPRPHQVAPASDLLTSREQEVFALVRRGLSNKEIASSLNIAEATVKNHVHHLLAKLHVGSRAQAVAFAQTSLIRQRPLVKASLPRTAS